MRRNQVFALILLVALSAGGMAALGIAYPQYSDLPLLMFYEPIILLVMIAVVCAIELVRRRLGIFAALICAAPMWMITGAAPQGLVGALIFFSVTFLIVGVGILAGMLIRQGLTARRR